MYNVVSVSPCNRTSGIANNRIGENDLSPRIAGFFTIVTSFVLELLVKEALVWFHHHIVIVTRRMNFRSSYSSVWICLL